MVLVTVGEDDPFDALGVLPQVGEVGEDEIDPGHVGGGEHQPAVDEEDAALHLDAGAVPPDLPQSPEEDDADGRFHGHRRATLVHPARRI
jgi:hypothetical protein